MNNNQQYYALSNPSPLGGEGPAQRGVRVPIITLDGPSGSGKGAVGRWLAKHLGWHYLDSGALYRLVALKALQQSIASDDASALCAIARGLQVVFEDKGAVYLEGHCVTDRIRSEACSQMASHIALLPVLREALFIRQRAFAKAPGLIADGRDMGTMIFPEAPFKFFLEASLEERVQRRYVQLKEAGQDVNLEDLRQQMALRDQRDSNRADAPLRPARDAVVIDTTVLGAEAVCAQIIQVVHSRLC